MSGSWPNESMQAKQFATFRSPRQTAARAGLRPRRVRGLDAGLSRSRRVTRSWPDSWPQAVSPYARLPARCGARFYICWRSRGPVAQGIEQQPSKLKVAGSNPAGVASKIRRFLHFSLTISAPKIGWGGMGAECKTDRNRVRQRDREAGRATPQVEPVGAAPMRSIDRRAIIHRRAQRLTSGLPTGSPLEVFTCLAVTSQRSLPPPSSSALWLPSSS